MIVTKMDVVVMMITFIRTRMRMMKMEMVMTIKMTMMTSAR